jgi:hypothetical protein
MGDAAPGPLSDLVAGNDATVVGAVNLQQSGLLAGDSDRCADFAGGRAEIGTPAALTGLTAFTVACIVSIDDLPGTGSYPNVISHRNTSVAKWALWLQGDDGGRLYFSMVNSANTWFAARAAFTPTPATVYHIVATYDDAGDRKARIYVNGAEVTYVEQQALTGTLKNGSAIGLCLGDRAGGGRTWYGRIDEAAVFGAILDGSQVKSLYQISAGILEA